MSGVRRPSFPQNLCRILVRRIVSVALSHCLPVCFLIPIELSLLLCLTQLQPLFAILVQNHHLLDLNLLDVWTSERNQGKQAHPVLKYRVQHGSHCCAAGICQHQRQRSKCKECGGAGICRFFARKLLNPKSLFAQEGRRIYRRSRRIYWRRSLPRSHLPRSPSRLYLWRLKKMRPETQVFIPAVGDTVSSSSMMVLFSCAEIRRSECMNVKTGSEGQGE